MPHSYHTWHWTCPCGINNLLLRENCLGCNCLRPEPKDIKLHTEQGYMRKVTPYRIIKILETLKKSQIKVKQ